MVERRKTERELRLEIVEICRRMYEKDLVAATDGNVSVRLRKDRILATPSGLHKGILKVEDLIVTDLQGRKCSGEHRPSSELRMHLKVYRERPDVSAVIHAHPPVSTAFTIAGVSLARCILPEVVLTMGGIPTTQYAMPTSEQGPEVIEEFIGKCDAMLLDRHGTLTVGDSLQAAFHKLEKVEHAAKITWMARQLGHVRTLEPKEIGDLLETRERLGLKGRIYHCSDCGACGKKRRDGSDWSQEDRERKRVDEERLVSLILDRVKKVLSPASGSS